MAGARPSSAAESYHIFVYGKYADPLFQRYRVVANYLADDRPNVTATVEGFFETQYEEQLRYTVNKYGGAFRQSSPSAPLVFVETEDSILFFANEDRFIQWAAKRFKFEEDEVEKPVIPESEDGEEEQASTDAWKDEEVEPGRMSKDNTRLILYKRIGIKAFKGVKERSGRSYCALGIQVGQEPKEVVHLELFDEDCPRLARNFIELLNSPRFNGHPVHRVKAGAWVQAGDLVDGSGRNSEAACGGFLRHESFQIRHDRPGLLGMANQGKDTNGSQFYITLRELPFLDENSVVIGRVISGMQSMLKISQMPTKNERPIDDITISAEPMYTIVGSLQSQ